MRAAIVLLASALLVTFSDGRAARACDCPEPPPPAEALEEADAVFAGDVTGRREVDDGPPGSWVHVRMEVAEVWKGDVHEVVEVRTHRDDATCGYGFVEGRQELVYASVDDEGRFATNLCTRTAPLAQAREDVAALGAADPPLSGERVDDSRSVGWLVPAAATLLGVALIMTVMWTRRRT